MPMQIRQVENGESKHFETVEAGQCPGVALLTADVAALGAGVKVNFEGVRAIDGVDITRRARARSSG